MSRSSVKITICRYKQELLGREGRWEIAFARFFQSPPSNTKDRTALRDVAVFLTPGTRHMSPRGFRAIADALEVRMYTCAVKGDVDAESNQFDTIFEVQ